MNILYNSMFGIAELKLRHRNKRIYSIDMELGLTSRNIEKACIGLSPKKIIPYLERIEQSSHNHYAICMCMLVENMLGIIISDKLALLRTAYLELERIYCHSLQLSRLLGYVQVPSVIANLSGIKNSIIDCFENLTGHRMFSTIHIPGGLRINFTPGNIELISETISSVKNRVARIEETVIDNLSLISIFNEIAIITPADKKLKKLTGVVAWCGGEFNDLRITKSYLGYLNSDIKNILISNRSNCDKNCAYSRIVAILDDIKKSMEIISYIINNDDISYDYRAITLNAVLPVGRYEQQIETPRGLATLTLKIAGAGRTEGLEIISPSDINFEILNDALKGTIVDFAQMAMDSLYLSIMEIDK